MKKNNKCERNCSHFFGKKRKGDKYMTTQVVNVIGAGLAGSEAAYQIAKTWCPSKIIRNETGKANASSSHR